jgi:O-antigen ligase
MMTTLDRPLRPVRRVLTDAPAAWYVAMALVLAVATILVARVSAVGSLVLVGGLLLTIAAATVRWPQPVTVLVVLAPILDRFVAGRVVPAGALAFVPYFSEALLLLVTGVLVVQSGRSGTLFPALRHPATVALGIFVTVAAISAVVNRVPAHIALAGLVYTLDAALLFYLVRIAGFERRHLRLAIIVLLGVVLLGAFIAVAQAVLSPSILGLTGVVGRSGEDVRIGSIVRDPNVFGTLIGLVLPFAVFATTRLPSEKDRRIAIGITFVLTLALLLTYSRGSWLGVGGGLVLVALLLERRALVTFAVIGVLALGTAYVLPRGLLPASPAADGTVEEVEPFNPLGSTVDRVGAIGEGRDLRWMFMMNAMPIVADHPLVGVGPGRYGGAVAWNFPTPIYAEYGTDDIIPVWYRQRTVDNFWLHILVETGVIGFAALMAAIALIVFPIVRVARRAGAGGLFVVAAGVVGAAATLSLSSVTTMLLEGNTVAFLFWFLLGLGSVASAGAWSAPRTAEKAAQV